jgi:hypothetical protein
VVRVLQKALEPIWSVQSEGRFKPDFDHRKAKLERERREVGVVATGIRHSMRQSHSREGWPSVSHSFYSYQC